MAIQANDITVKLTVQDDATSTLNRVQRELDETGREGRQAFDKVDRSAEKAGRELRNFESKSDKARLSVAKLATGLAAAYAAFQTFRRVGEAGLGLIEAAAKFEESAAKFGVVFGDEAQRVASEIEDLSGTVRRSQVELVTAASRFQDLFVPMGLTRDAAADLSLKLVRLSVDLGSFNNVADAQVIADLQSALVGNSETVRKYGILIDEARIKQVAYNTGIAEAGEELTQQQKVLARYQILLADSADAQGDAARTANSFENTIKGIRGAVTDLSVVFGQDLTKATLEVIEDLGGVEGVVDLLKVGLGLTSEATQFFIRALGELGKTAQSFIDGFGGADKLIRAFRGELEKTPAAAQAFERAFQRLPEIFAKSGEALLAIAGVVGEQLAEILFGGFGTTIDDVISKTVVQVTVGAGRRAGESFVDATARAIEDGAIKTDLSASLLAKSIEGGLEDIDLKAARLQIANELGLLPELLGVTRGLVAEQFRALGVDASASFQTAVIDFGKTAPEVLDVAFGNIARKIDDNDLEKALARSISSIQALDRDFARIDEIAGIGKAKTALEKALGELRASLASAASDLGQGFVDDVEPIELRVSDFFDVPATAEIVEFFAGFFGEVKAVADAQAQGLIDLFDFGGDAEAQGRENGASYIRGLQAGLEDFVPAEDPLLDFLGLSEQADQVATLNSILAGTFDEAAAQVQDYYDGLREAAIARANSSRESQELLQKELELLGRLEERDLRLARIQEDRMTLAGQLGAMLNEQKIQQDLVNQSVQAFDQLVGGLAQSFVDSEASFADFRDQFIQSIAQMIVKALLLLAIQAALGAADLGAFGDVLKLAAGLPAEGKRKGGVIPNVGSMSFGSAPGVTKGDQGFHDTFFFAKGGVMPIHKYATGGVARTPQLAVFGEGRGAEAFVPLPDGARIPVKMDGGAQDVTVNLSVQSLDPRGAADVVLQQMPLIRREIAGALREGSDRTLLEGVRGASRR